MNLFAADSGLPPFIAQSDAVGTTLFATLLAMSLVSWSIIATKALALRRRERRSRDFLASFWNAASLDAVAGQLSARGTADPFSALAHQALQARAHHARYGAVRLAEAGSEADFVTRTIKKVLDEESTRLENGLTVLATVGATAPFVGLFGTVWGVYHALVAVSVAGSGSIDRVAGPVGEALIMTALGLAVAIPAVVGYNALVRAHRVLTARLDAFAFELQTFVSMGQPIRGALHAGRVDAGGSPDRQSSRQPDDRRLAAEPARSATPASAT